MLPMIFVRYPVPCAVMQPQTISEPPPCLTVGRQVRLDNVSPRCFQHHTRPSEPRRLILLSSDTTTLYQYSTVQSLWRMANSMRALRWRRDNIGFLTFGAACNPLSLSALWT